MTDRERFLASMSFGEIDRLCIAPGDLRGATITRWHKEGLPKDADIDEYFGFDRWESLPVNYGFIPPIEPRTLEETEKYKIWIDGVGAKRMDFKELPEPGFVTRKWFEFAVKNRRDFQNIKEKMDPATPERLPADWKKRVKEYADRDYVLGAALVPGLFGIVRHWVGFENLCIMTIENPQLVHEMMDYLADFNISLLERALSEVKIDYIEFFEDMAYKTAMMISPEMYHKFMMPGYKRLVRFLKDHDVPVICVDSDGHISELIPLWIEAGVNATSPVEIAANNDVLAYRKKFGEKMAYWGAIDKRQLSKDIETVEIEIMSKVPAMAKLGGYIPNVDHAVPADIPLENYEYALELIRSIRF